MQDNTILITGGAGFIGTHIAEKFCDTNKIVLLDNLWRNSLESLPELKKHPNVKFINGDVVNRNDVKNALRNCNIVIHLAAIAGVSNYYNEPDLTLRVNMLGTLNLLECCREIKIEKIIDFSTSEVYGPDAFDVHEDSFLSLGPVSDFRWTYAVSKLSSEQLTLRYSESHAFKAYTIRPFNIYGPRQTGEGAISNFFRAVINHKPIVIYGDGSPVRAWCYISDCVEAIDKILRTDDLDNGTFNIGNPQETYSTLGLARMVSQVVNKDIPIVFKKMDRTEIRVRVPNISRAKRLLDFQPSTSLPEGLQKTWNWFKNQKEQDAE